MTHWRMPGDFVPVGHHWLPQVPSNWRVSDLKWLATIFAGGTPDKAEVSYWDEGTIPWLGSGEVNQKLITSPTTCITELGFRNSSAKWIPRGALVMALAGQGKTRGTVAQLGIDATCNQSMAAIVPRGIHPRFLLWWLEANYTNLRGISGDDTRDGLNLEIVGNVICPVPPEREQLLIVDLLDRETARIDALIEKKARFIELLGEKRQAVVHHLVARGLDPAAPTRQSDLGWLGHIPSHWRLVPLRWLASCTSGDGIDAESVDLEASADGAVPVIGGNGVMGFGDRANTLTPVLAVGRVGALCGNVHLISDPAWITDNALVVRVTDPELRLRYLEHVLRARKLNELAAKTAQPLITGGQLRAESIPLPPISEQDAISEAIQVSLARIDRLTDRISHSVALLRESRAALITAAVTGQIDVRADQPAEDLESA